MDRLAGLGPYLRADIIALVSGAAAFRPALAIWCADGGIGPLRRTITDGSGAARLVVTRPRCHRPRPPSWM
jgi:hypothetical protein